MRRIIAIRSLVAILIIATLAILHNFNVSLPDYAGCLAAILFGYTIGSLQTFLEMEIEEDSARYGD